MVNVSPASIQLSFSYLIFFFLYELFSYTNKCENATYYL